MSNCTGCGQFRGRGHVCPPTAPATIPGYQPADVQTRNAPLSAEVEARVQRAFERINRRREQYPDRPAFRKEWTNGAAGYAEADTFAALKEGMKRKRTQQMVHMPNDGEAGDQPCGHCGIKLRDPYSMNGGDSPRDHVDGESTWFYSPKTKTAVGMHYGCSWGAIMNSVFKVGKGVPLN